MTPLGFAITLFLALVVLLPSRRMAALAVVAGVCYITQGQQFVVGGFHFTAIRVILLAAFLRTLFRRELRSIRFNKIDWALTAFILVVSGVSVVREGTHDELVYRLGCLYDMLLPYWVFRALLANWEEAEQFLCGLALLIIPLALEMVYETVTSSNLFASFGGIGELTIREGRARSEGAFRHGITAGVFGATLMPVFLGFILVGKRRGRMITGLVATVIITYTSNSSGPLMAFLCGLVGWFFWPLRHKMKTVRWGIVAMLVALQCCMKVPVYYIFSKLSDITGGDGWHRSFLIDQTINHFSGWWVLGTSDTGSWMATTLPNGKADITDQYVAAALNGGLAGLILLVLVLTRAFSGLGLAIREMRRRSLATEWLLWGVGAALFAHLVTFFDVSYWDQLGVFWYAFLALISSSTASNLKCEQAMTSSEDIPESSSGEPSGSQLGDAEFGHEKIINA